MIWFCSSRRRHTRFDCDWSSDVCSSDLLLEEVIADLSRVRALTVISRTSAVKLKQTDWDLRRIGRELNVRYALEGSVRRAGSALRITAQLIDVETEEHLWAEKYSGTVDDVFDLQERLSQIGRAHV